jgi:hypothetical protein
MSRPFKGLHGRVLTEKVRSVPKKNLNVHSLDRKGRKKASRFPSKLKKIVKTPGRKLQWNQPRNPLSHDWNQNNNHQQKQSHQDVRNKLNRGRKRNRHRNQGQSNTDHGGQGHFNQPVINRGPPKNRPARLILESYRNYRLLNPVHHAIQYYEESHRPGRTRGQFPVKDHQNRVHTPQTLFSQQTEVLSNLRKFYEASEKIFDGMTRNGTYRDVSPAHAEHWKHKLKVDEGAPQFEMNANEFNLIRAQIQTILKNDPQRVRLCQQICTPTEYYYSWDFCLLTCRVRYEFLSNIKDVFRNTALFKPIPWQPIGGRGKERSRNEVLSFGDGVNHHWKITDLEKLWKGHEVESCSVSWTSIDCNF